MRLPGSTFCYRHKGKSLDKLQEDLDIEDKIERICLEFPRYGYRRVTKELQRSKWLRCVFVEASWVAIRSSSVYCRSYFERMKDRKNSNVAIAALARRLSEIAYRCLKEKRSYEEYPYSHIQDNISLTCPPKFLAF